MNDFVTVDSATIKKLKEFYVCVEANINSYKLMNDNFSICDVKYWNTHVKPLFKEILR